MNTVITISRQYGSSGREIGKILADGLGLPFYDKEALKGVAAEMGVTDSMLEALGERHASSLLHSLAMGSYSFGYHEASHQRPISQTATLVAFDAIKKVARQSPCVIVGRCADYVLENTAHCVSLFIHAPLAVRTDTVARRLQIGEGEAVAKIKDMDRLRQRYYNYYTTKSWGEMDSYHLAVDSSVFGVADTARMLGEMLCMQGARTAASPG